MGLKTLRLAALLVVLLGLAGCSAGPPAVMPDVAGKTLDVAKSDIKHAGIGEDLEVLGGGTFGILKDRNWTVCEQRPASGEKVTDKPTLKVARSCGTEPAEPSPTPSAESPAATAPSQTESTPAPQGIDAAAIEAKFNEHLHNNFIESIHDMCDAAYTHWACFYDGVESGSGFLRINLSTDGGWTNTALRKVADSAGRHWFNFIGCDYPDLSMIVVTVNGLDYNVARPASADVTCG
ncbi:MULTISPECIES: hypothetical protein [unclassified Microbacterium]|uniref:PASTA domain-containing protein n=1 Tax=unclassified Microbacterium TaxID=2609290 RepID=UPI0036503D8E